MRDSVKKAKSFVTFERPLHTEYIRQQFVDTQQRLQAEIPEWSTSATRQQIISAYWFTEVVQHFAAIFIIPALLTFIVNAAPFNSLTLLPILLGGVTSYLILYLFHYRPYFSSTFLPRLETIKEAYERKQAAQLEKCRKAQLPNATLILIHYVMDKAAGINAIQSTNEFCHLLNKLYGVDPQNLKNIIGLFLGSSIKRKTLDGRGKTEIANRFAEATSFFEELDFQEGIRILQQLEERVLHSGKQPT